MIRCANTVLAIVGAVAIALVAGGCAPTTTVARGSTSSVEAELIKQQSLALNLMLSRYARLDSLGWPILSANVQLCKSQRLGFGIRAASRRDLGRDLEKGWENQLNTTNDATIISISAGSPAERGGLQVGDQLVSIGGKTVSSGRGAHKKVRKLIRKQASAGNSLEFAVYRPGSDETVVSNLVPQEICDVEVLIVDDDRINAFTDGIRLVFNLGMIRFAESDWELQLVFAHELAHVVEGHIDKKLGNALIGAVIDGVITGASGYYSNTFSNLGLSAFSQEFEREADYVGLYIMARSGLDTAQAANFWRRIAAESPLQNSKTAPFARTHPAAAERFANIEATHEEIQHKIQAGLPLIPERRKDL